LGVGILDLYIPLAKQTLPAKWQTKVWRTTNSRIVDESIFSKADANYYKPHWMHGVFLDGMNDDDIEELLLQEISNWDEGISSSKWYISNSSNLSQQAFSFSLALMSWRLPRIPPKVPCNSS
jgi:hypothetical protein